MVFGPERLPEVLRNIGRFVGGARRSFDALRTELEREVGADELKRELHNARIMEEAKQLENMVRKGQDEVEEMLGSRYAALKEEGAILDRAEDSGETAGDEAVANEPAVESATAPSAAPPNAEQDAARADAANADVATADSAPEPTTATDATQRKAPSAAPPDATR